MVVGFSGTRKGMTAAQASTVRDVLQLWYRDARDGEAMVLRHGDCVGADEEVHWIATEEGYDVIVHPPDNDKLRAFCADKLPDAVRSVLPPQPYTPRNGSIVRLSDVLLAATRWNRGGEPTALRGEGTLNAINQARRARVRVVTVYADGSTDGVIPE